MNIKHLSVADFIIKLQSEKDYLFELEDSYLPFEIQAEKQQHDLLITVVNGIPLQLKEQGKLLFEAKDTNQNYFSIELYDTYLKCIVFDQHSIGKVQQIALLKNDFSEWTIYVDSSNLEAVKYPLLYPMGPLILYYLTVKFNAIMIHASGVFDGEKGRIFTGFSGNGKSTMAYLWQSAGAGIVNDDRLIIRNEGDKYFMYNTPMYYSDISKKVPLHEIHLIRHNPENIIKKITGAKAVSGVMAFCIQHGYNSRYIEQHLAFLSQLFRHVSIYEVGFVPDLSIVDYIRKNAE